MEDIVSDKIKEYAKVKNRFYFINIFFVIIVILIFFLSGASGYLKILIQKQVSNFYIILSLYFLVFSVSFYILGLPLEYYETYIIEHKYNLSNQSKLSWFKENIKKGLVSLVLGYIMIQILYFFLSNCPHTWWVLTASFWFLLTVILSKAAPIIILPLFYKQKPLEDKELKDKLIALCEKANRKVKNVYEIDMSKETKKANAALVGSGSTRRILLSDTLLNNYNSEEIEVILAHELAHHAKKHMRKILAFGCLLSFAGFYIAYIGLNRAVSFFELEGVYDISGFPILMLFLTLFSVTITPLQNSFVRKIEKEADAFALRLTGLYDAFITAMKKLSEQNLSDPSPSRFIEIMLYDHPPISKRISLALNMKDEQKNEG